MKKVINIEGREIAFVTNGATLILYKQKFKKQFFNELFSVANIISGDVLQAETQPDIDLSKLDGFDIAGVMDSFNEIAYICALSADSTIGEYYDWMSKFDTPLSLFPYMNEILEVIISDVAPTIKAKN